LTQKDLPKRTKRNKISRPLFSVLEIQPNISVWVIPDIHSCVHTLARLLGSLPVKKSDLYIFLGDYINKGNHPIDTLNLLQEFSRHKDTVFLRGNHDQMLMDAWKNPGSIFEKQIFALNSGELLGKEQEYRHFFEQTIHYVETPNHFFVHAGFDLKSANAFEDIERMMMIRDFDYDGEVAKDKTIIRGHYPHVISDIQHMLESKSKAISLDNGCVYPEREGMGNLLAYEIHSGQLIIQPNLDQI
jgi:serine/threonine protein phosphatase 1